MTTKFVKEIQHKILYYRSDEEPPTESISEPLWTPYIPPGDKNLWFVFGSLVACYNSDIISAPYEFIWRFTRPEIFNSKWNQFFQQINNLSGTGVGTTERAFFATDARPTAGITVHQEYVSNMRPNSFPYGEDNDDNEMFLFDGSLPVPSTEFPWIYSTFRTTFSGEANISRWSAGEIYGHYVGHYRLNRFYRPGDIARVRNAVTGNDSYWMCVESHLSHDDNHPIDTFVSTVDVLGAFSLAGQALYYENRDFSGLPATASIPSTAEGDAIFNDADGNLCMFNNTSHTEIIRWNNVDPSDVSDSVTVSGLPTDLGIIRGATIQADTNYLLIAYGEGGANIEVYESLEPFTAETQSLSFLPTYTLENTDADLRTSGMFTWNGRTYVLQLNTTDRRVTVYSQNEPTDNFGSIGTFTGPDNTFVQGAYADDDDDIVYFLTQSGEVYTFDNTASWHATGLPNADFSYTRRTDLGFRSDYVSLAGFKITADAEQGFQPLGMRYWSLYQPLTTQYPR